MLPNFSYDSLVLMTIVNLLTTGSVMMFVWNADRPGPGLMQMAWGDLLIGFGLLLTAFKSILPGGFLPLASNLAVFAGVMLIWSGIRAFRGFRPLPISLIVGISVAYSSAFTYWIFVNNNSVARVFFGSASLSLLTLLAAGTMFLDVPRMDGRLYYFTGTLLSLHALTLAVRASWALSLMPASAILIGSPVDATTLFSLNFVVTGCGLAVATASSRKLYHTTRKLALHDPLTQLPNRRMFEDRLQELNRMHAPCHVALIYLDLDNFKMVNDKFGHSGGDHVLRIIGQRLTAKFTGPGFPARLGGDEFVVLMECPESRQAASAVMTDVIRAIQSEISVDEIAVSIDVSAGMAMFPEDVPTLSELTDLADRYMYRAKSHNRQFAALMGASAMDASAFTPVPKSLA